ncbi:MAG: NUDIX domain-containing protein [Desulfobacteraceae bacterium]|nr:NUDIX domain-containing protein [Desulfobacteraceae bacterium]
MMHPKIAIAYFITSHGFGHAARASAVMNAIGSKWPFVHFEIFTQTPEWFFKDSLRVSYVYHLEMTDVGLVQTSPFCFDESKSLDALDAFLPFDERRLAMLADAVNRSNCLLAVCDISPLGIAVAKKAGISSVLVENFTWDWIYASYLPSNRRFGKHITYLENIFASADIRIQADPVCFADRTALCAPPVSRFPRAASEQTRSRLGRQLSDRIVLITMGGIPEKVSLVEQLQACGQDVYFIVPGASGDLPFDGRKQKNIILLPHRSGFYHPDLIAAADAVVGKLGYSTLAEVYQAGVPFGYIPRSDFRESGIFESYIEKNMKGVRISEADFYSVSWLSQLPGLLALPERNAKQANGANVAAEYICARLACEKKIIEVVDREGRVVGAAPRDCVHGDNQLLHRVVHVLVFDANNRLLLQKRSRNKKIAPGRWDTSVGGHVDCGETIETAMMREMDEELGICPDAPCFAYHYIHTNNVESELVFTYICQFNGLIRFNPEEIDAVKFWTMAEIEAATGHGVLSDNFEDEFMRYRRWKEGLR